jgi:hypothetical protein
VNGFLYYDDSGKIKNVSLFPLRNAVSDCVEIQRPLAEKFLRGEEVHEQWIVNIKGRYPILKPLRERTEGIDVKIGPFREIKTVFGQHNLAVQYATETNEINFYFMGTGARIDEANRWMKFFMTSKRDTLDVRACFVLDLDRLSSGHTITWQLPVKWDDRFTIIHSSINIGCVVEKTRFITSFIPMLSSQYSKYVRVPRSTENPLLVCSQKKNKISLEWRKTGGRLYDRDIEELPFIVTRRGDPSFLISQFMVPLGELKKKKITEKIDTAEEVDLYTLMYFADMALR